MGIRLKRSAISGKAPTTADLELGELALNTFDGKLYAKRNNGTEAIVEIGGGAVTSVAGKTGAVTLAIGDVTNLQSSLDTKAASSHSHAIADVTNLQSFLDGKAASSHTHTSAQITDFAAAVGAIAGGSLLNVRYYAASGTYTKTSGTKRIIAFGCGGGGGGAGGYYSSGGSGGGGGGGCFLRFLDVTTLDNIPITIGAGGAGSGGAQSGVQYGGTGGTTQFGTSGAYGNATGGIGAEKTTGDGANGDGGAGGSATNGTVNFSGGRGTVGIGTVSHVSGTSFSPGFGGVVTFFGQGGPGMGGRGRTSAGVGSGNAGNAGALLIFEFG